MSPAHAKSLYQASLGHLENASMANAGLLVAASGTCLSNPDDLAQGYSLDMFGFGVSGTVLACRTSG